MASKRKTSSRIQVEVSERVTKKVKVSHVVLDSHTINYVLPKLSIDDFDKCMLALGPQEWKKATENVSSQDAKKLVLIIISRPVLIQAFAVFLSLWEMEQKPASFLYELGLGQNIRQSLLMPDPKTCYLSLMRIDGNEKNLYPLLPELEHKPRPVQLGKHFVKNDVAKMMTRLDVATLTPLQCYYYKLSSALTCSKLHRWSECLAFSLSALDSYQPNASHHLHDVLSLIAHSASKMSIDIGWCCKVLEEGRLCSTSIDHIWRRVIVFQNCLKDNGFFELENEVYIHSLGVFVQGTEYYQIFKVTHLQAKLAQIENNLAYQYGRQHFHNDCDDFCEKRPRIEQSFEAISRLLLFCDTLAQTISMLGVKEYFRGYIYLYSSMKQVHAQEKSTTYLNLAISFFQLAKELMKVTDPLYLDLMMMSGFLRKVPLTIHAINLHFSKKTLTKNTTGASQFYFRAMLVTMYWDNHFQPFPINMLVSNAKESEIKATNNKGYRVAFISALHKVVDGTHVHAADNDMEDFPLLSINKDGLAKARAYWEKETTGVVFCPMQWQPPTPHPNTDQQQPSIEEIILDPPSAQALMRQNRMVEQVYAFGLQIVKAWTEAQV